ncbi:MAG TPA: hypothetical protein VKZ77_06165 [Bacillaceae bacterium]|nr:hypothetical protein [Bacillaceae bacterium]
MTNLKTINFIKMKKVNFKSISSDEILTRDELRKIIGGNGSGDIDDGTTEDDSKWATFRCHCHGNGGITWVGKYKDTQQMINYIYGTCTQGGSCTAI